jgi:hypothetical protein
LQLEKQFKLKTSTDLGKVINFRSFPENDSVSISFILDPISNAIDLM